ncbi:MAG TPA: lipid A deacylase LpxR family protein [Opitutaceae bacterium]
MPTVSTYSLRSGRAAALAATLAAGSIVARGFAAPENKPPASTVDNLRFGSVSLYTENDKYFAGTDQHYTNGFKLSFLSTDLAGFTSDPVPKPVQTVARLLGSLVPPGRAYKLGLSLGQNIYTPEDIETTTYLPHDRPYAAWLYVGAAFQVYEPPRADAPAARAFARLDTFEVTLGVVGPWALGRQVQNGFHDLIGVDHAEGWDNQLHNEPGLNLVYERKYRIATPGARTGWGADFIPHIGVSLGNVFTYANAGFEVRAGHRLPSDFGTNLIRPSGDSNSGRSGLSVFLFGAVDGRAVARDLTLDGNSFRDSPSVDKKYFVADLLAGVAVGTPHWQLTYAQAVRTEEFDGQPDDSVFGSISVTFYY